ncbi:hypothetical protein [Paludibacter jiangxiensis]|uniref:Uncharacterized protein n=1 Tax=Paludibacter jiangxiensis TaxID=681398 RepID=A0A170ZJA5_9BACT|nr:hypothetical protein [Paludibacter jiangxiensis]GAT62723.1 hypothetical protein PJIAN_326 [Paludibacter jiangxiensis]
MQITEKQRNRILQIMYGAGYLLLMIATVFYFSQIKVAPYIFSLGVLFLVVVRVVLPIDQSDFRTRRLNKIHAFATLVLVASAYGMFIHHYLWIAGLLIATILDLYISFRLPKQKQSN